VHRRGRDLRLHPPIRQLEETRISRPPAGQLTHPHRLPPPHRTQLIESAWAYQHRPNLGATLRRRQERVEAATVARSWKAQQRLCARFRRLSARKTSRNIVTVAIARELAGFCWAEMTATD
jgi:hypothetical protein